MTRRILMCPPEHFGVLYEINPWMHAEVAVDLDLARTQWDGLVGVLRAAGAEVEVLEPVEGLPDLVFTANAGVVNRDCFVPSRFRHPQRQGEVPHYVDWFSSHDFEVAYLPDGIAHEGAGDAVPMGRLFLSGYRQRSDAAAHFALSRLLGVPVRPVELSDPRFYHFDLTFCPLDDRRAMVSAGAWDTYGRRVVASVVPEPLALEAEETAAFCANSVVVDTTVVMPHCPPRVGRQLEAWGFTPVEASVGEFQKAGGACRCLTLALDVDTGGPTAPAPPQRRSG